MMKNFLMLITIFCLLTPHFTTLIEATPYTSDIKFYAFYESSCPSCRDEMEEPFLLLKPVVETFGKDNLITFDTRETNNGDRYSRIVALLEYYLVLPVVGIFKNGTLTAIVSGNCEEDGWRNILEAEYDKVPVYAKGSKTPIKMIDDSRTIDAISKLFVVDTESINIGAHPNVFSLLPIIVAAAAVDAINPCEFCLLTAMISLVFYGEKKGAVLKMGTAFSIGTFIAYYLMGFGIVQLVAYTTSARYAVAILGLTIGVRAILNMIFSIFGFSMGLRDVIGGFLSKKFKHVPDAFSKKMSTYLGKAASNPKAAFAVGAMSTLFLSPCTSGPYFIALSLISNLQSFLEGLFLVTIYNAIFIMPLIAITLGVYALKLTTKSLKKWSSKKRRWLDLLSGLLMIAISTYLLLFLRSS